MPVIENSSYLAPRWLPGGHAQTVHPVLFRKVAMVTNRSERLELDDGDYLDLEWRGDSGKRLVIISHGLEGSSKATYVQGMAAAALRRGWDVLAWSFRGCSGEINRLPSFYHSGKTEDLDLVIRHALRTHPTERISLIGFSLGGNLTLKFIGERGTSIHPAIDSAVAFSVPCELACCSKRLGEPQNRIYLERFLKSLRAKITHKQKAFPGLIDAEGLARIRSFAEFDDRYTAPLHGFKDAEDYWERSSCRRVLDGISIPTLLVTAANDPILGANCYPYAEASGSSDFFFEVPKAGGHVGFGAGKEYWSETRATDFIGANELSCRA